MPTISPARKAAFEILLAIERGRDHSDDLLRGASTRTLSVVDQNLATTLVLGVLRWQIRLDHAIRPLLKKPNAKLDPEVLIALRLGAFQLLFLDRVPAHAAIDESVELAKHAGHRFASGMVNAVLRRLAGGASERLPEDSPSEIALAHAHPAWMVERWIKFYGIEAARAICRHGQEQPRLSVRMNHPDAEAELVHAGIQLAPGSLLTSARSVISGDVTATDAFRSGRLRIQDEGSQLIGELAAGSASGLVQNEEKNQRKILDACAAPGGKTLILAERNPQAQIVASESNPKRLAELKERLAALADRVEFRLADASALTGESIFDVVLADVPCSGTGTLGRNPEIRHKLRLEDLPRQAERQQAILRAAIRAAKPGGLVVYSTCSLEPEENEEVLATILAETPAARLLAFPDQIQSLLERGILTAAGAEHLRSCLTPQGALRLLPGKIPTDGFFVALIEKTR
jgi:16S rRNA (cytosine967-C5)-methyltransferase